MSVRTGEVLEGVVVGVIVVTTIVGLLELVVTARVVRVVVPVFVEDADKLDVRGVSRFGFLMREEQRGYMAFAVKFENGVV